MRRRDDDMSAWRDDPVVRALTAPASSAELAGEEAALAGFRAAMAGRSRRRFAGRFGAGATTMVVAIGLSGGVAAAYTRSLPAPIQQAVHTAFGSIGVPSAPHHRLSAAARHHGATVTAATGSVAPQPAGSIPAGSPVIATRPAPPPPTPSATPSHKPPHRAAAAPSSPAAVVPSSPPPSAATVTTSPPPSSPAPPVASVAGLSVSSDRVPAGEGDTAFGTITDGDGRPVPDHAVRLVERLTGGSGAQQIGSATTDGSGAVTLPVPALSHSVVLRLLAGNGIHSTPLRVVVLPVMTTSMTADGNDYDVQLSVAGASAGDAVMVQRLGRGGWSAERTVRLDAQGAVAFTVPVPPRRQVRYRAVLRPTSAHGYAAAGFVAVAQ